MEPENRDFQHCGENAVGLLLGALSHKRHPVALGLAVHAAELVRMLAEAYAFAGGSGRGRG